MVTVINFTYMYFGVHSISEEGYLQRVCRIISQIMSVARPGQLEVVLGGPNLEIYWLGLLVSWEGRDGKAVRSEPPRLIN